MFATARTSTIASRSQPEFCWMALPPIVATTQVIASAAIAPTASCPSSTSRPYVLSQIPRSRLDIPRLHPCALGQDATQEADRDPTRGQDGHEDERDRGCVTRPRRPDAFAEPEHAEGHEHRADDELEQVLGYGRERLPQRRGDRDDDHPRRDRAPDGGVERGHSLRAERDDDERDLDALEEYGLVRDECAHPVPSGPLETLRAKLGDLPAIDLLLVVQRDDAREPQHRLAQPAKPEEQEQRPDEAEKQMLRDDGHERDPQRRDDHRERE